MRTLAKAWVLVLTTAVMASVLAAPALAEDPSGVGQAQRWHDRQGPRRCARVVARRNRHRRAQ